MLAYALELKTTICRIAYSIWLGARRITRIGLKIMGWVGQCVAPISEGVSRVK